MPSQLLSADGTALQAHKPTRAQKKAFDVSAMFTSKQHPTLHECLAVHTGAHRFGFTSFLDCSDIRSILAIISKQMSQVSHGTRLLQHPRNVLQNMNDGIIWRIEHLRTLCATPSGGLLG